MLDYDLTRFDTIVRENVLCHDICFNICRCILAIELILKVCVNGKSIVGSFATYETQFSALSTLFRMREKEKHHYEVLHNCPMTVDELGAAERP